MGRPAAGRGSPGSNPCPGPQFPFLKLPQREIDSKDRMTMQVKLLEGATRQKLHNCYFSFLPPPVSVKSPPSRLGRTSLGKCQKGAGPRAWPCAGSNCLPQAYPAALPCKAVPTGSDSRPRQQRNLRTLGNGEGVDSVAGTTSPELVPFGSAFPVSSPEP